MKSVFFTLLVFVFFSALQAQNQQFKDLHPDSVMRQDPRFANLRVQPGEVLVKFADDLRINISTINGISKIGITALDQLFEKYQVWDAEQVFPGTIRRAEKQFITTYSGEVFEVPDLHNIYRLKTEKDQKTVNELISELNKAEQIVYAEPNALYTLVGNEPYDCSANLISNKSGKRQSNKSSLSVNDPFYNQQGYISAIHADSVWNITTGDSTEVIAILDTGIDWLHPDLVNKIWTNDNEQQDYIDNDGNGFTDDIRGWDFVNNDNNPLDDNGHGTHVAGIAGAETNNGIGIAGVSWKARLMPIKVFNSAGYGDAGTIAQGIQYAAANGASILNMSFGGYYRSFTMENALLNAYLSADLVAASGNDGFSIYAWAGSWPTTAYPAALPFVLGVQANAGFSNYDPDGPIYSTDLEGLNYELKAPGIAYSTYPNGSYRTLSGTSMSTPIVAGAIALYKAAHPNRNKEELWGDLIHFSNDIINIQESVTNDSKFPILDLKAVALSDTLGGNDGDGFYDAGETILLTTTIRNTFGFADSVYVKLQYNEYENPEDVTFLVDSAFLGSMSTYATRDNYATPLKIFINPLINNDKLITVDLQMKNTGDTNEYVQQIQFRVYNGTDISGLITQDTTLTPDKLWLFNASARIDNGVTMTVMPGTHVEINAGVDNRGTIICEGTADSLIYLKGGFSGNVSYKYTDINLKGGNINTTTLSNCKVYNFERLEANFIYKSDIYESENAYLYIDSLTRSRISNLLVLNGYISSVHYSVIQNIAGFPTISNLSNSVIEDIINIYVYIYPNWPNLWSKKYLKSIGSLNNPSVSGNSFLSAGYWAYFIQTTGSLSSVNLPDNYWGTENTDKIKSKYADFWDDASTPFLIYEPKLSAPSPQAPGHVWKVLIDGIDGQDEAFEPFGVGSHKFEVYFNRPMDISYDPLVTFGVRYPYNQQVVSDSSSWSADSTIYTVWKTFELYTGDGINRIRVANARDTDGWDIPIEDNRFELLVDAAGSASIDFTASPGIGKVDLEWHEPDDLPTLLGYNMYRFHHLTDTTFSDTTLVNSNLINDTLFTDFNVDPLEKYYYMYKIVRTDFTESDYSKVVNATVLTASPGDANGDQTVNVLDITSIVGHILNQNPQPFLSEAADVNEDGAINLLDIIGVVNIIMGNNKQPQFSVPAYAYLEPESIQFKSDGSLSGFQFQLISPGIEELEFKSLLPGYEFIKLIRGDTLTGLIFSMDNKAIPEGKIKLFEVTNHPGTLSWGELFAGNLNGDYVPVYKDATQLPEDYRYNFTLYPNPSQGAITLELYVPETSDIEITVFNTLGQTVYQRSEKDLTKGNHKLQLNITGQHAQGLHYVNITYQPKSKTGSMGYRKVKKMILQ
jgi:subtilisin family serine protease